MSKDGNIFSDWLLSVEFDTDTSLNEETVSTYVDQLDEALRDTFEKWKNEMASKGVKINTIMWNR